VCVPHRPSALPVPWEEVLNGAGTGGSDSGHGTPDADEYDMRLGQLQVRRLFVWTLNGLAASNSCPWIIMYYRCHTSCMYFYSTQV
jgi:hypothetical protein